MNKERAFLVNMAASIITFLVSFGIKLFFTPYITETVGGEAYGFVGLANSFVNYITIITIALNSVAGRFITVKYHQGNKKEASEYFTSVLISNVVFAAVISFVCIPLILRLETFINISPELVVSVKYLFVYIYINFILNIVGTVYTTATFITNKLYLSSIANIMTALTKVILLVLFFGTLRPSVAYIGLATCLSTLVGLILNVIYTKRLIPDIKIKAAYLSVSKIKELFGSGIWSSITKLSQVLSDGLDLLITNLWISASYMGQLSIAQTIPNYISSLMSTIINLFSPNLTMYYAKNETENIVSELKMSMKLTAFFSNIIFCVIVVFGEYFYQLWVPEQNVHMIYLLSIVIMMSVLVSGVTTSLNNIFLVTNKLKVNSLVWLVISALNVLIVFILLQTTSLGVFAVAGVSKITGIIANLVYLPIYAAMCLNIKKTTFYPIIVRYMMTTVFMAGVLFVIRLFIVQPESWAGFILLCAVCGMIGLVINYRLLLNKKERSVLTGRLTAKIRKKGKA